MVEMAVLRFHSGIESHRRNPSPLRRHAPIPVVVTSVNGHDRPWFRPRSTRCGGALPWLLQWRHQPSTASTLRSNTVAQLPDQVALGNAVAAEIYVPVVRTSPEKLVRQRSVAHMSTTAYRRCTHSIVGIQRRQGPTHHRLASILSDSYRPRWISTRTHLSVETYRQLPPSMRVKDNRLSVRQIVLASC